MAVNVHLQEVNNCIVAVHLEKITVTFPIITISKKWPLKKEMAQCIEKKQQILKRMSIIILVILFLNRF